MSNSSKCSILNAAKCLFGAKGFDGASVRDISKHAKVNIAMIKYYFGSKEELYKSCLENFVNDRVEQLGKILEKPLSQQDFILRLRSVLTMMADDYPENGPLVKMLLREMLNEKKSENKNRLNLVTPFFFLFRSYFQSAIDAGIISKTKSADHITLIFLGALSHPIQAEIPMKKALGVTMSDENFRKTYSEHLVEVFINGVIS